jgi:hypothetical protein
MLPLCSIGLVMGRLLRLQIKVSFCSASAGSGSCQVQRFCFFVDLFWGFGLYLLFAFFTPHLSVILNFLLASPG